MLAISLLIFCFPATAQVFVAGLGGTSALSGKSVILAAPASAASYDPAVGPAVNLALGYHFNDWVSAQAGWIWNRNRLTTRQLVGGSFSLYQDEPAQHAFALDAMLYFRGRDSRLRPYLSAGPGVVSQIEERGAALRVAVGIDIAAYRSWKFRYSFSEMISGNPFATRLNPPASGGLMNFQNLFGIVKTF